MKFVASLLPLALLASCATTAVRPQDSLARIAEDYVHLTLEAGEREAGYVDAYYGPAEWQAAAKANPRSVADLRTAALALKARLAAFDTTKLDPDNRRRHAFLNSQLTAAVTRLRMMQGEKLSFAEESTGLFGTTPVLKPLSSYDPVLTRIERLVPGSGALADRVDAFQDKFNIPTARLRPVMDAAIAECRRRTLEHIALPANESFTLELVTGKSWGGYNYYKGNAHSLIQINTDLPVRMSRAVDLGCHEGYPGHHVLNTLLEERLTKAKGWTEFSVYPLYSPQSLIAEGSANYGIQLAFPADEQLTFERATLYPLADLPTAEAAKYLALQEAMRDLAGARFTIARDFLDGRIDRAEAVRLTQKYQLVSKARAEKSIDFTTEYRSYVINYGLGQDMVRDYLEAGGRDPAVRWARMERVIAEPTLPSDLLKR